MTGDRDVTDLLKANYTFIDERLAKHYGIQNIKGSRFRRVTLTDETRFGILGHASVLTATSMANRTSPVSRGKWILEQILGVKAPVPPPNVPALKENTEGVKPLTVRDRLEQHRRVEPCASCHKIMDPLGFALEGFDAVGARRLRDGAHAIDASGQLYDGTKVDGPVSLRRALVDRSDVFVRNFTQNLLTYALGRGVEYYDMPAVRGIARDTAANENRFSSIILGIVNSVPFQMRRAEEAATATAGDSGRRPQGDRR
jgi:hypothetical protein